MRTGMVEWPEEHRWSSARAHLTGKDATGLLDWDIWRQQGGAKGGSELLTSQEELQELRLLRRCTYAGRPFGEDEFVQAVETKLQRRWRRWGFEKRPLAARATD